MQRRLNFSDAYDVAVIGGGVHGAAIAWEAQQRGFSTVLFEKSDFASGVSANALKIVHGGLRYLQTFDFKRSRQSAQEQSRLLDLAPHLVSPLSCWMPTYRELKKSRLAMALGLWGYQRFIRPRSSHQLPACKTTSLRDLLRVADIPVSEAMTGAANWCDAQVHNPERLVLSYLFTARQLGASVFNYLGVEDIQSFQADQHAITVSDQFNNRVHQVNARQVIATCAINRHWVPQIRAVNLVLQERLGDVAIGLRQLPEQTNRNENSRLLFFVPWRNRTIVGTWYFPDRTGLGTAITKMELERCLEDIGQVWPKLEPSPEKIRLIHIGRLPAESEGDEPQRLLERPHISTTDGVIRVAGVKYTTARIVANQVMDLAVKTLGAPTITKRKNIPLYSSDFGNYDNFTAATTRKYEKRLPEEVLKRLLKEYGSLIHAILDSTTEHAGSCAPVPGTDNVIAGEVIHALTKEMACTVADVLLRRSGVGTIGRPAWETIEYVARLMGEMSGWMESTIQDECQSMLDYYERVIG